jgi:1,4-dihydroxy-2-naphthoate polyprenyltransferase
MNPARGQKLLAWLAASRLTFYIGPSIAFTLGAAAAASHTGEPVRWLACLLGFAGIVLVEFITVITNELCDLPSDRINAHHGIFTGGSRVLVSGRLTELELRRGRAFAVSFLVLVVAAAWFVVTSWWPVLTLATAGLALGIGYSAEPLRLSARGLGELDVALSLSAFVVLAGWLSQSALWWDAVPWLLSLPLGVAVLPSITLAAFPDLEADRTTGKFTLAVRVGRRKAALVAAVSAVVAALLPLFLSGQFPSWYWWCAVPALPHALWLCWLLYRYVRRGSGEGRIDSLLINALCFTVWFCLLPLIGFLGVAGSATLDGTLNISLVSSIPE